MTIDKSHVDVFYPRHPYYKQLIRHINPDDFTHKSTVKWLLEGFGGPEPGPRELIYLRKIVVAMSKRSGGHAVRLPHFKRLTDNALKRLIAKLRIVDNMDANEISVALNIYPATARKVVNEVDRRIKNYVKVPDMD